MARMNHVSPEEVAHLLSSVSETAARRGCSFSEAIRHLTLLARQDAPEPVRRDPHEFARRLLRVRAQRNEILATEIMRDPAWDMLLDLYAHEGRTRGMMVSALCAASGVPQTTALRHIYRLAELGLVEITDHPTDQRRTMVRLAADVPPRMERLLGMFQDCS
jgi:DNA-binding transcriptional ArsR family regulator